MTWDVISLAVLRNNFAEGKYWGVTVMSINRSGNQRRKEKGKGDQLSKSRTSPRPSKSCRTFKIPKINHTFQLSLSPLMPQSAVAATSTFQARSRSHTKHQPPCFWSLSHPHYLSFLHQVNITHRPHKHLISPTPPSHITNHHSYSSSTWTHHDLPQAKYFLLSSTILSSITYKLKANGR